MMGLCQFLEWDSDFFRYRIARVIPQILTVEQASDIDKWCHENEIDCLYFLAESQHPETVRIVEDNHYRQVDIRHVYEIKTSQWETSSISLNEDTILDVAKTSDTQDMLAMIDNSFIHTRFYYDPYFTNEQANNLYSKWLERSINEDLADQVIVIRKRGKAQGFITCNLDHDNKIGIIGLLGVADFARGKNLGTILVSQSINYFKQEGMKQVQVVTQGRNIGANRLYQKCGFRTQSIYLWYHKWFRTNP